MTTRPESFVTFPGDVGVFHSRAGVNELDADTAHGFQSGGKWSSLYAIVDEPAAFSGKAWSFDMGGTTNNVQTDGDDAVALTVEPWAFGVFLEPEDAGDRTYLQVDFYDSGGGALGNSGPIDDILNTPAGRQARGGTFTPPANTATGKLRVYYREPGGAPVDKILRWDSVVVRKGTDPTFVPSPWIVGDLELEADCAATVWGFVGGEKVIIGADNNVSGNRAWKMGHTEGGGGVTDGRLRLVIWLAGGPVIANSSIPIPLADAERGLVKVTREVATGDITFYADGVAFGATVPSPPGPAERADAIFVAGRGDGLEPFDGTMWGAWARDGIGGPAVGLWVPDEILGGAVP